MPSHVYHKLYYHLIWGTKNRLPLITPKIEDKLKSYLPQKIKDSDGHLMEMNMVEDHLHVLLSIPPAISISDFVHAIKGSSSHYINDELAEKELYWQEGYGILTLSEKGIPIVREYIKNQKRHHRDNDLINILECYSVD